MCKVKIQVANLSPAFLVTDELVGYDYLIYYYGEDNMDFCRGFIKALLDSGAEITSNAKKIFVGILNDLLPMDFMPYLEEGQGKRGINSPDWKELTKVE